MASINPARAQIFHGVASLDRYAWLQVRVNAEERQHFRQFQLLVDAIAMACCADMMAEREEKEK
jgi:hypothetical protein